MKNLKKVIGKKCGMTQRFDSNGNVIPCTVIYVEPNVISQIKTTENDGYNAIQLASIEVAPGNEFKQRRRVGKPILGHFKKAGLEARRHLVENRLDDVSAYQVAQTIGVDTFTDVKYVDVTGTSKGKGYQGVMKKYGFAGGAASHGAGPTHRHAGSTGQRSTPGRSYPNSPRASHMGCQRKTVQGLQVVAVYPDKNLLLVKGQVPGATGSLVYVQEAVKKS